MKRVAVAVAVAVALAGCTLSVASGGEAEKFTGKVSSVQDGDTLTVEGVRVRVLGIDAPEIAHEDAAADCGGGAAKDALNSLVWRKTVTVTTDPVADREDRYGRRLGYVALGEIDVGRYQIEHGWAEAWHPKSAPAPARYGSYRGKEATAKASAVGNWATCATQGRTKGTP